MNLAVLPRRSFTEEEYLLIERQAEYMSENLDGEIFHLSGASDKQKRITENLSINFGIFLRGKKCWVYSSDMRINTQGKGDEFNLYRRNESNLWDLIQELSLENKIYFRWIDSHLPMLDVYNGVEF